MGTYGTNHKTLVSSRWWFWCPTMSAGVSSLRYHHLLMYLSVAYPSLNRELAMRISMYDQQKYTYVEGNERSPHHALVPSLRGLRRSDHSSREREPDNHRCCCHAAPSLPSMYKYRTIENCAVDTLNDDVASWHSNNRRVKLHTPQCTTPSPSAGAAHNVTKHKIVHFKEQSKTNTPKISSSNI